MPSKFLNSLSILVFLFLLPYLLNGRRTPSLNLNSSVSFDDSIAYLWPLPKDFTYGTRTLSIDPDLALHIEIPGEESSIVTEAFERYKGLIFKHWARFERPMGSAGYDVGEITVVVSSDNETLQLGVDESYNLYVGRGEGLSIVGGVTIEATTVYGAIRGLETFSQLCIFNYETKTVEVYNTPWYIQDEPRFAFRGLLLDTSRHYLPVNVIKQVIESMSYAKLVRNVLFFSSRSPLVLRTVILMNFYGLLLSSNPDTLYVASEVSNTS